MESPVSTAATPVTEVKVALFADLALLKTEGAPASLALDTTERRFQVGQRAYHVGFPQGRPGEAYSRLIGRETLVARGRYESEEPVLAWAELGRTSGLRGSLAGISGGPAIAANGQVIGVTVAESARRGRIYTAAPSSILRLLRVENVDAEGSPSPRLTRNWASSTRPPSGRPRRLTWRRCSRRTNTATGSSSTRTASRIGWNDAGGLLANSTTIIDEALT